MFLEILQNSQENTLVRVSFLIKLPASVRKVIKNKALAQVFFCEFREISENTFFTDLSKNILACLFSIHNTISLSRHEQVRLTRQKYLLMTCKLIVLTPLSASVLKFDKLL